MRIELVGYLYRSWSWSWGRDSFVVSMAELAGAQDEKEVKKKVELDLVQC
jgi:hypothetical protein